MNSRHHDNPAAPSTEATPDTQAADRTFDPYPPLYTPTQRRWMAAAWLAGALAILGVAIWLSPDDKGYGTHRQMGLGKCGMLVNTGLPCPTCGMTTAFSHTVRAQLVSAFWAQPGGLLLALALVASVPIAARVLWTGRRPPIQPERYSATFMLFVMLVVLVGGWGFKLLIGLADGTFPDRP